MRRQPVSWIYAGLLALASEAFALVRRLPVGALALLAAVRHLLTRAQLEKLGHLIGPVEAAVGADTTHNRLWMRAGVRHASL